MNPAGGDAQLMMPGGIYGGGSTMTAPPTSQPPGGPVPFGLPPGLPPFIPGMAVPGMGINIPPPSSMPGGVIPPPMVSGPPPQIPLSTAFPQRTPSEWTEHKAPDGSDSSDESSKKIEVPQVRDRKEATEIFKGLLRDKNVSSNASWEQVIRLCNRDPRFNAMCQSVKKQAFHAYKVQKLKEEREEVRQKVKKAKEDFEIFLLNNDKMSSIVTYHRCEEMFGDTEFWRAVPDADRRDIYEDVIVLLAKREKEEAKATKKRNMKKLGALLEGMTGITFQTTWQEGQQMLLSSSTFMQDRELLAMDKKDAVIVFERHIRGTVTRVVTDLEKDEMEEITQERSRKIRIERKNRDAFTRLLDELHEQGKLTSMSLWVELYPMISSDPRFSQILGQPGSSPLDLFKFYVEDLKSRYEDERKVIKDILKEKGFDIEVRTTFEQFATIVCEDKRAAKLDAGNVKLTFNSLLEKAESKAKEKAKEEAKRSKVMAQELIELFRTHGVNYLTTWEEIRSKLDSTSTDAFKAISSESDRRRMFEEYVHEKEETCLHHHHEVKVNVKKAKKAKKHKKRASSSESDLRSSSESESDRKRNKKRTKKKKQRSRYSSGSSGDSLTDRKTDKKSSSKRRREVSADTNELSESELEKQRALLLQQLKYAGGAD